MFPNQPMMVWLDQLPFLVLTITLYAMLVSAVLPQLFTRAEIKQLSFGISTILVIGCLMMVGFAWTLILFVAPLFSWAHPLGPWTSAYWPFCIFLIAWWFVSLASILNGPFMPWR